MATSIYRLVDLYGIKIIYRDLHSWNPALDGYACTREGWIYLDQSIKATRQGKCVLLEEVGHCLFPPIADHLTFHSNRYWSLSYDERNNLRLLVEKDERAARKWATDYGIRDRAFWDFVRDGPHTWREWLEHFEVEDWFMRAKVRFMRAKCSFNLRQIILREGRCGDSGLRISG